jgi:hypothetical protein
VRPVFFWLLFPFPLFSIFPFSSEPLLFTCDHEEVTDKEYHARAIVQTLRERGFTAYFAGGVCVTHC